MRHLFSITWILLFAITAGLSADADSSYEKIVADSPNTAQGNFDTAQWCAANGLPAARDTHLRRAIALDPDFAPARHALGYVLVGDAWLKTRNEVVRIASPPSSPPNDDVAAASPNDKAAPKKRKAAPRPVNNDPDRWIKDIISSWRVTLHSIRRAYLVSGSKVASPASFNVGADRILAINDSLAIEAISGVLSTGPDDVRRLMVGALKRFSEDEATMNILVSAILDPARDVREDAARALASRRDPRMIDVLRMALRSYEEAILTGAAETLGSLKGIEAMPELVLLLKGDRRLAPPVTRRTLFDTIHDHYGQPRSVQVGPRRGTHRPKLAVVSPNAAIQPARRKRTIVQRPPEFRTAIQEALIKMTGQNFGFDEKAWMRWLDQQKADADKNEPAQGR